METEETLRRRVRALYESSPVVHLNVTLPRPKLILRDAEATITGVYNHIFQITESSTGTLRRHTISYADMITRRVEILELAQDKE